MTDRELSLMKIRHKSIEFKMRNLISDFINRDPADIWDTVPLRNQVLRYFADSAGVDFSVVPDEFDGMHYESELYLLTIVRLMEDLFDMKLEDEVNPTNLSLNELRDLVFAKKGYRLE